MKKRILFVIVTLLMVFTLGACNGGNATTKAQDGVGYGITHKDNVGVGNMTVNNGVVQSFSIDEVFLPNTWAKLSYNEGTLPDDALDVDGTWYGKYIVIGDKQFTGVVRDTPLVIDDVTFSKQTVKYSAEGIDDLYLYVRESEANAKWYADQVLNDNAFVAKDDWTATDYDFAGENGFTKSETNYWPGDENSLGWAGNMQALSTALEGKTLSANDQLVKTEEGYWKINDVVSGATMSSFKDYYAVALKAYNNAIANTNTNE